MVEGIDLARFYSLEFFVEVDRVEGEAASYLDVVDGFTVVVNLVLLRLCYDTDLRLLHLSLLLVLGK